MNPVRMIKSLIRMAIIGAFSSDDKEFPKHTVEYMGKVGDAIAWYPYGFHANPGKGTLAIALSLGSNAENRIVMPGSPKERIAEDLLPTPLKEGELMFYHPLTKSHIHLKEDGSVDIKSVADLNIQVDGNLIANVDGDADIDVDGTVDIDATGDITLTAPNVDINGDMAIVGDVTLTGNLEHTGDSEQTGDALVGDGGTVDLGGVGGEPVALGDPSVGSIVLSSRVQGGSSKVNVVL